MAKSYWQPTNFDRPDAGRLGQIANLFSEIYAPSEYGNLAEDITPYWIAKLKQAWDDKAQKIKLKDQTFEAGSPLSRIEQKTVLIAYADSLRENAKPTLKSLDKFLKTHFPAVKGLHILPPCEISEERFNDGGFSQIRRDRIHPPYGSNTDFEALMEKYFSMTDFVLNHVDIEHPQFQRYLDGEDRAGNCFFVFSEKEYQNRLANGDFAQVFRPRPFPLFTIFRRKPRGRHASKSHDQKIRLINERFQAGGLNVLPVEIINLLFIFGKIQNDQMLLDQEFQHISIFREFLTRIASIDLHRLFTVSATQETRHKPYIFQPDIDSMPVFLQTILPLLDESADKAHLYADIFLDADSDLFGEPIRALTTFSHVQVDLNTSTIEGLKLLIDDFSWYLKMDLNMLRLDAANFAFKKWGTTCFGLPEVHKLLKILYLSMEAVAPRIVPNLEVNAPLSSVLKQMADKEAPPPMMYDFHLPSMLPAVFNLADTQPLLVIFKLIHHYDIPHDSIRFSLDESHDGKSVNGSGGADPLLTYAQRNTLIEIVEANGGHVKYKSTPKQRYPLEEFKKVCHETGLDATAAIDFLFVDPNTKTLVLKEDIRTTTDILRALNLPSEQKKHTAALNFFTDKILNGREPYELCISTRDSMARCKDPYLEAKRYLAFKTLAFALMGRHVKATYFNDLLALPNDDQLVKETGELRNIKRTKSDWQTIDKLVCDPSCFEYWIAGLLNNTIALVDADPSLHPCGHEARLSVDDKALSLALVHNHYLDHHTLAIVNTSKTRRKVKINLSDYGLNADTDIVDNISAATIQNPGRIQTVELNLGAYDRLWLKNKLVRISPVVLKDVGTEAEMKKALTGSN